MKDADCVRKIANRYANQLLLCHSQSCESFSLARTVHAHMMCSGFKPRGHVINRLIDIYCKGSKLVYARKLLDEIPYQDVVARTTLVSAYSVAGDMKMAREMFRETSLSVRDTVFYNAMITGFTRNNDGHAAFDLFLQMLRDDVRPDNFTFTSVLSGFSLIVDDERQCMQMHCVVMKSGTGLVTSVLNALVSVYVKCASSPFVSSALLMEAARKVFDEMPQRDELSWTTMISGYVRNDDLDSARAFLDGMSEKLTVVWNAMISGYVHHEFYHEALETFRKMLRLEIQLDSFTYTGVITACSNAGLFQLGKQVHAYLLRTYMKSIQDDTLSENNALISFYSRCSKIDAALYVFDHMKVRDLVSWNAILSTYVNAGCIQEAYSHFKNMPEKNLLSWTVMIAALAQNGFPEEGLKLFCKMKGDGLEPCDYAFAGSITSCAVLGSLENGRQLHAQIVRSGYEASLSAANALITMYARCGVVEAANCVFYTMPFLDPVSWNAMIAALGQHGRGTEALELYEQMLNEGILPDRITFLTILSACNHAGLVEEGRRYFDSMHKLYKINPGEDHYARVIDLLCRAGRFSEAMNVIESMPFKPGAPVWETLLAGCRIHGNMELGVKAAEKLFDLIPQHDGTYILLSNIYSALGRWDDAAKVRKLMRDRGVKKEPGCSWIEVENKVHIFLVDDSVHPEVQAIYSYLEEMLMKLRKLGYVPDTKFVLHDMESDQKEYAVTTHSEKLAVVFGLMKLPRGATIRVFKNLRICGDCHNAIKLMSKVADREIVVRDGKRFHHFRNGECSCGDYW